MRNYFKFLGLALLALIAVQAVGAAAAQAKPDFLLLLGGASVSKLTLIPEVLPGSLLVVGLGLDIRCTGGTGLVTVEEIGTAGLETVNDVKGSGEISFTGCKVFDSKGNENKNCTVKSAGAAAGLIAAKGSTTGKTTTMNGAGETLASISSAEFTKILIEGALCPLNETEEIVSGKVTLAVPAGEATTQLVKVLDLGLKFGEETAALHAIGESGVPIVAHVKDLDATKAWGIGLKELP